MSWKECVHEEIVILKDGSMLMLPWESPDENETLWKYEVNGVPVAFMKLAPDPEGGSAIYIDEFEVIKGCRRMGLGKRFVSEFLNGLTVDVKVLAANKDAQLFWEKCGFVDDGITWAEIPLIYKADKVCNPNLLYFHDALSWSQFNGKLESEDTLIVSSYRPDGCYSTTYIRYENMEQLAAIICANDYDKLFCDGEDYAVFCTEGKRLDSYVSGLEETFIANLQEAIAKIKLMQL